MLTELRITDLGVIGEAIIEPDPGFTAVTGETGAGKTMIVTGLTLLAGAKADSGLVRAGSTRALVEGRWQLEDTEQVADLGARIEDGEVLVARLISPTRSRMSIGGAQLPVAAGAELVGEWVTVHGQSEQVRLAQPERQLQMLDRYAGPELAGELQTYRERYSKRRALRAELAGLVDNARERARELDLLRFGLAEIERVTPLPGEDAALAVESVRLQSVDDLRLGVAAAQLALSGDDSDFDAPDALGLVGVARKALRTLQEQDPELAAIGAGLGEAAALLADVSAELASYAAGLDADPIRLEWIAGRRAELASLTRKYGETIDEVLGWAENAVQQVVALDAGDTRVEQLRAEIELLDHELGERATRLTQLREAAATELAELVRIELVALAMPNARLSFEITPLPEPGPNGVDQVALMFTANAGNAPRALAKAASGGELSRVRLALEVVLASGTSAQTFIFDEIDAGVGGTVALEIGRRLARLANNCQVIVVTHLAQVAAFADRHFLVSKSDDGSVTTSGVRQVEENDRLQVLATMMGGLESSESALAHAQELLDLAR